MYEFRSFKERRKDKWKSYTIVGISVFTHNENGQLSFIASSAVNVDMPLDDALNQMDCDMFDYINDSNKKQYDTCLQNIKSYIQK